MPSRYLNGYQTKIIRHALKAELKAKRDGLVTRGDEFCRGYAEMMRRAQKQKALERKTYEALDRILESSPRDFELGFAAALYDLDAVYYGTQAEQRTLALKLDWYEKSQANKKKRAERKEAQAALIKELSEL